MLSIKNNLQVIAASYNNFLGWTITKSTDLHDRDELLIYPKSESDFRPINENDLSNKRLFLNNLRYFPAFAYHIVSSLNF